MAKKPAYDDIVDNLKGKIWFYLVLAFTVFGIVFNFSPEIIDWIAERLLPEDATLIYLSPAEFFLLKLRIAGYSAISLNYTLML